jgi:hypothetical protein
MCKIKFCEYITFTFFAKRYLNILNFFYIFTFCISYLVLVGNFNRICILVNLTIILYNTFLFKQPKIRLAGNIARPCSVFLSYGILGGWGQDQLPTRRQFQLIAATLK